VSERDLWAAVVLRARADALGLERSQAAAREREAAARWFREGGPDFRFVVHLAGLEPARAREAVVRDPRCPL